mmetsp:Transcript_21621/g.42472  ORF Transcript_21621/g.42472 Transcript_21621/m.42472 type:complete len:209 (+) Transcript_21621:411-1037(+)
MKLIMSIATGDRSTRRFAENFVTVSPHLRLSEVLCSPSRNLATRSSRSRLYLKIAELNWASRKLASSSRASSRSLSGRNPAIASRTSSSSASCSGGFFVRSSSGMNIVGEPSCEAAGAVGTGTACSRCRSVLLLTSASCCPTFLKCPSNSGHSALDCNGVTGRDVANRMQLPSRRLPLSLISRIIASVASPDPAAGPVPGIDAMVLCR